jgi:hypothetical protein
VLTTRYTAVLFIKTNEPREDIAMLIGTEHAIAVDGLTVTRTGPYEWEVRRGDGKVYVVVEKSVYEPDGWDEDGTPNSYCHAGEDYAGEAWAVHAVLMAEQLYDRLEMERAEREGWLQQALAASGDEIPF